MFYNASMRSKLISIFLMFWLALQGVVAFAMPLCQHQQADTVAAVQNQVEHCAHAAVGADLQADTECDNCAGCQFCSMTELPKILHFDPVVPDRSLQGMAMVTVHEPFIDLPYRPPIL
jgi:hypothetical protein